jgi:pSer/pThr/pTyr-binding forkhead associated (FHA) protein
LAKLIIFEESNHADAVFEAYELSEDSVLIGADRDNHLVLQSPDVDSTHASLQLRDNHWYLQDLGGPGGTSVNGQLIEGPRMLHHNDIIDLGPVKMRFHHAERGVTREVPRPHVTPIVEEPIDEEEEVYGSGRVWFAKMAGLTTIIIFAILALLLLAYLFGLLTVSDLIPFGG